MNKTEKMEEILEDFLKKLLNNMEDIDPEFIHIVNENFWDLI